MQNAHKYYVSFSQLKKKKKAKRSEAESDPPLYVKRESSDFVWWHFIYPWFCSILAFLIVHLYFW